MAVQKVEKKTVAQAPKAAVKGKVQEETHTTITMIADQFAKADLKVRALKETPIFKEHEVLKAQMLLILDDTYDAETKGKVMGIPDSVTSKPGVCVEFSVKKASTEIGTEKLPKIKAMKQLHKMLGDDVFYQLATLSITSLKDYVPAKQVETFTTVTREGARTVKGVKLA